jgi:hypothetical protein
LKNQRQTANTCLLSPNTLARDTSRAGNSLISKDSYLLHSTSCRFKNNRDTWEMMVTDTKHLSPVSSIHCRDCVHYFITHEPETPHGCRRYRFKSRQMPAITVLQSSDLPCQFYCGRRDKMGA